MREEIDWRQSDAFLVKVFRSDGELHGFVQSVRTGETTRFHDIQGLADAIARLRADGPRRDGTPDASGGGR